MKKAYEIIKRPIVTERTRQLDELNKVVFAVDRKATKPEIRAAIEHLFEVTVQDVNTMVMPGRRKRFGRIEGRRSAWKKAVITLAAGQKLSLFGETIEAEEV